MASATLLKGSLLVALLLPGVLAGLATWAWWVSLARPALFLVGSLVALYSLSAYLMVRQFSHIGISGQRTAEQATNTGGLLQSVLMREATVSLAVFLVLSGLILWLLRWVLSFTRS